MDKLERYDVWVDVIERTHGTQPSVLLRTTLGMAGRSIVSTARLHELETEAQSALEAVGELRGTVDQLTAAIKNLKHDTRDAREAVDVREPNADAVLLARRLDTFFDVTLGSR